MKKLKIKEKDYLHKVYRDIIVYYNLKSINGYIPVHSEMLLSDLKMN